MNPPSFEKRRRFSWPIAITLSVVIVAIALIFIFLRVESWPGRTVKQGTAELERLGRNVRDAFVEVAHLQPRIMINSHVYIEKTTAVAELAILSRQIEVEHELTHTWAGSTKRVKLHGTFTAKAGFDLQRDVVVNVRQDEVSVRLPHASIVGLEQQQVEVLALDNGFWNRISAGDLENELAALPALARQKAAGSGMLEEAEVTLRNQLNARIHADQRLNLQFENSPIKD